MTSGSNRVFRRVHWMVNGDVLSARERGTFRSMDSLLQAPMEQVTLDARSGVSTLRLQSLYYVKAFKTPGSPLWYWLGISRYQRELRNLLYFKQLGLATPQLVAYGHASQLGLLRSAVIVTAQVKDATDLEQVIRAGALYHGGVESVRRIFDQLARAARTLHRQGFYHRDLKTRNILLRKSSPAGAHNGAATPELFFFDCPSGHHPPRFMLRRCMVRDLAHLEEGLRGHVRAVDLMYLFKQYRGHDKLSPEDKALARDALSYYAQRRMTRKRRRRVRQKQSKTQV